MAQIGIREYDAKKMFFESIGKKYNGMQIKSEKDLKNLEKEKKYVLKPDMLFGKRGKLGLLGINLDKKEAKSWFLENFDKEIKIGKTKGKLEVFLAEDFVKHKQEYYISFSANREFDEINFSFEGGIEIEENWEKVKTLKISVLEDLKEKDLEFFGDLEKKVKEIILQLWNFYKNYGFVYLEVNPFCFDNDGELVLLDMVAKIDDQEAFMQKQNWKDLEFPETFGFIENKAEKYIKKLDSETGASLKMKILNPEAKIWTLLAGGGGSLVITDTLGALGFAENIGNYGELSGNPDRDFTREYTKTLFSEMLKSKAKNKYLIIAGAIANFTDVSKTFDGIIDALEENEKEFKKQKIQILVRRGGINEQKGLEKLKKTCEKLEIPAKIYGSEAYMTEILKEIK
ncbi:ATPase [Candidatus Gracilibacteria bacterium]|nr:MAG: ATPase [Candidatus Gracilibacteria bacterium]